MPIIRIEDPKIFIGLSVTDACKQAAEHEYNIRVVKQDSRQGVLYKFDYDPLRLNLFVEKDMVVDATIG
jgi:hypothetical protein